MATCYWCIVQSGSGTVCDRPKQALFVPLGCKALTHKLRAPSLKIQENEKHECRLAQNRLVRDKLTVQGHCVRLNRVTSHQLIYLSLYNCQLLMGKTRTSANQLLFFFFTAFTSVLTPWSCSIPQQIFPSLLSWLCDTILSTIFCLQSISVVQKSQGSPKHSWCLQVSAFSKFHGGFCLNFVLLPGLLVPLSNPLTRHKGTASPGIKQRGAFSWCPHIQVLLIFSKP